MQKSIHVLQLIENLEVGGAEKVVCELVQAFPRYKIRSFVCVYRDRGKLAHDLAKAQYPIIFIPKSLWKGSKFLKYLLFPVILAEPFVFMVKLIRLIKKLKIDIVQSHMFSANFWGRLSLLPIRRKVKIITTEHTIKGWHKPRKHAFFNRLLAPLSHRVVAVSQTIAQDVLKEQKIDPRKLVVIPNAVRVQEERAWPIKSLPADLPGSQPVLASIGRLATIKRHDLLLRALRQCLDHSIPFTCWVIGDGPERSNLMELSKRLNLSRYVFFLGERTDVSHLLQFIQLVINTSDVEGLPYSLIESMAAGIPILATDVGGNRELVKTGATGILTRPGDVEAIARGIIRLLQNPTLREKMGRTARKKIQESYSLSKVIDQWQQLYQEVVND